MGPGRAAADARHHGARRLTEISLVTIAWRNEPFAPAFAASLGAGPDQLVVVVNGPEGDAAASAIGDDAADVVRLPTNAGFSGGANAGVDVASGDVVVLANLDLTFDGGFFDRLRQVIDEPWDLLAPAVTQGADGTDAGASRRTRLHRLAWVVPPPAAGRVEGGNGACLVLRRTTLERRNRAVGGLFEPEYHSYNEDIDLFWWAEREGLTVRYEPSLRVNHALAGSFDGRYRFADRTADVQRRVMCNYRLTAWKHARGAEWLGWLGGEASYLGQAVAAAGPAGLARYAGSWPDAVRAARAVRTRRGSLRSTRRS